MSDATPGAGNVRKTIPRKRVKNAYRRSGTALNLKDWLRRQNGELKKWGQQWLSNKRR